MARSRIIAFLDSDDEWMPTKVEIQFAQLCDIGGVAAFTSQIINQDGKKSLFHIKKNVTLNDIIKSNILSTTSSAMIIREQFLSIDGFDESLPSCQDWDLWIRLRQKGDFVLIDEPLVIFHQDKDDRISKNFDAVIEGHKIVFSKAEKLSESNIDLRRIKSAHAFRMAQIFYQEIVDLSSARINAWKSFLLWPNKRSANLMRKIILKTCF